ncbi:MAG: ABC transporter permease, partial [Bacteroidota bacterium]
MRHMLARSSLRYLRRHPWLFALSVLGVALGVAVVVAIDIANASARRAFELSTEAVAGRATHQIQRPDGPLADSVYVTIRRDVGYRASAPVVEGYATTEGQTVRLIGIDVFAEEPFRGYTSGRAFELADFMLEPTALLSVDHAERLDAQVGAWLTIRVAGRTDSLRVLSLIEPSDDRQRRALDDLLIVDVSTAQQLFDMSGQLSYVDLVIEDNEEAVIEELTGGLPAGVIIQRSEARTRTVEQMTQAFDLNLSALSLLALVVGMFLIYNTMTFSVVQRRGLIGRLRTVGVTRRQIVWSVLGEALLMAMIGTIAGLGLGVALAAQLVDLVARTINDLYFVVNVTALSVEPQILLKGIGLGVLATMAAAYLPAREAARVPAGVAMQRSTQETTARIRAPRLAIGGLVLGAVGGAILLLSGRSIALSYGGMLGLILGFALLIPLLIVGATRLVSRPAGAIFGLTGRMAARGLQTALSRVGVAVAALTVAIAATIGVGVMVESFRETVNVWLGHTLRAD